VNDESDKLDMEKEWRKGSVRHCFFMRRTIGKFPLGGKGKIDPR